MEEKAKETLKKLLDKQEYLRDQFNSYVALMVEELEIDEKLARTLVTDQLVHNNFKKLVLIEMVDDSILKKNGLK